MSSFALSRSKSRFLANRAEFYTDLASALRDKSDLVTEMTNMLNRAQERKKTGDIQLYRSWLNRLEAGSLTEAMGGTLPKSDLMIMRAFENSGKLTEGLDFLAKIVKLAAKMKKTILGAVIGPTIVLLLIMGILALHAFMLTPIMEQIYPVEEWPTAGKLLYPLAQAIKHYGILLVAGVVLVIAGFIWSINRWKGPKRVILDNRLPYSIFRDYNGSLFLTSLSAMMQSGVGVMESLRSLEALSTPWMKWHIQQMMGRLDSFPDEPARALATGAIPGAVMDRIIDYGKRSSFLEAMAMIGLDSLARTEEKLASKATLLNMIMVGFAGVLFVLIIGGVMSTGMHAQDVIRAKIG